MSAPSSAWKPGEWAARRMAADWWDRRMERPRDWYSPTDFWTSRHCLYRMYDNAGRLIYIGVSSSLPERMYIHSRTTDWYPEVARLVVKLYPSRRSLFEAERNAIRSEGPLYNVKHSLRVVKASA